eukprot:UN09678
MKLLLITIFALIALLSIQTINAAKSSRLLLGTDERRGRRRGGVARGVGVGALNNGVLPINTGLLPLNSQLLGARPFVRPRTPILRRDRISFFGVTLSLQQKCDLFKCAEACCIDQLGIWCCTLIEAGIPDIPGIDDGVVGSGAVDIVDPILPTLPTLPILPTRTVGSVVDGSVVAPAVSDLAWKPCIRHRDCVPWICM